VRNNTTERIHDKREVDEADENEFECLKSAEYPAKAHWHPNNHFYLAAPLAHLPVVPKPAMSFLP
jgi:hypothetical protein